MLKPANPKFAERVQEKFSKNAFAHDLHFQLDEVKPGLCSGHLRLEPRHMQQDGFAHGGVVLALCDIIAGFSAYTLVPADKGVVTAEIKVSCLRPGKAEKLVAKGTVLKPGRNLYFCESEIWAEPSGLLIAKATTIMAVIHYNTRRV